MNPDLFIKQPGFDSSQAKAISLESLITKGENGSIAIVKGPIPPARQPSHSPIVYLARINGIGQFGELSSARSKTRASS